MASATSADTETLLVADFSGGWNCRAAPSELQPNESPDALNVTLDERGGIVKRLGLSRYDTGSTLNGLTIDYLFWSQVLGYFLFVNGKDMYKLTSPSSATLIKSFSVAGQVSCVDFLGVVAIVHPVDGIWTYDGAAFTNRHATVKGSAIASWQNKLWVSGDPTADTRVYYSNAGSYTAYGAPDFVDIREQDDEPVTALCTAQGLLVYKRRATFRIINSANGSYNMLSPEVGAAGPYAVASLYGRIASISDTGIYVTDGVKTPEPVSGRIENLFTPTQLNMSKLSLFAAGTYRDRFVFSIPRGTATVNDTTLEYHPIVGWIMPHSFGVAAFATMLGTDATLYAGSRRSVNGRVYEVFAGGSDDGDQIEGRYQTTWYTPSSQTLCRFRRVRLAGRGNLLFMVRTDYTTGVGDGRTITFPSHGFIWNAASSIWNDSATIWGPGEYEQFNDSYSYGTGRAISFALVEKSATSSFSPKVVIDGSPEEVGAFALYSIRTDYIPLGLA